MLELVSLALESGSGHPVPSRREKAAVDDAQRVVREVRPELVGEVASPTVPAPSASRRARADSRRVCVQSGSPADPPLKCSQVSPDSSVRTSSPLERRTGYAAAIWRAMDARFWIAPSLRRSKVLRGVPL